MALAVDMAHRRRALAEALVRPRPSLDRIPRLHDVLTHTCEQIGAAVASLVPDISASLLSVNEGRTQEHLGPHWQSELCAVFVAKEAPGELLVHLSTASMIAFVTQALGGNSPVASTVWPRSGLSRIEIAIARAAAVAVASALSEGLRSIGSALTLELVTIGDDQSTLAAACNDSPAVAARISLNRLPTMPWATIVLPLDMLSPFVSKLASVPKKATASSLGDPVWRRRIESELAHASINVTAVLETREATLEALTGLKVGDILPLTATASSHITLESEDVPLYACELGKQNGMLTVRIESKLGSPVAPAKMPGAAPQTAKGGGSA